MSTTGGKSPYRYQIQAGGLPLGLAMSQDGTISGKPTARGTYSVTIDAVDSANPGNQGQHTLSITIS
jgi:hypothetical protein